MTDQYDREAGRRAFAIERSHKDAGSSNDAARSTAQAVILINGGANGGAATAILAFLSKTGLDPLIFMTAAICLGLYAIGVAAGAVMMYCSTRTLDLYSVRWRLAAHPEEFSTEEDQRKLAEKWWKGMRRSFYSSTAIFLLASVILAGMMLWLYSQNAPAPSPPPPPSATVPPRPSRNDNSAHVFGQRVVVDFTRQHLDRFLIHAVGNLGA
jgi:hypothetical protein